MKPIVSTADLPQLDGFVIVDARGHRCPVPTLKLRRQMEQASAGHGVMLYATDPMAQIDVPHFCNQNSYILLKAEQVDEVWIFAVQRQTDEVSR